MIETAIKCGLAVGVVNLIWLYLAYYLGLHTNGIWVFQGFVLVWFVLTLIGFIVTLRAVKRANPQLSYLGGLGAGTVAAIMSALVAIVMQIGYYTVIHPAWPEFMAGQTREHFTAQGMSQAQVEQIVEQARGTFTLTNYATTSAITALITGIVLSAIIMLFLRHRSVTEAAVTSTA